MADKTPIGFLDSWTCRFGADSLDFVELGTSPVLANFPEEGVVFCEKDGSRICLDRSGIEDLMSCTWASHLLLEDQRLLAEREFWAFPPPVSPSTPFGNVPSSADVGCTELLRHGTFLFESLCVQRIGLVEGVDVGLGLFARRPIPRGTYLGEYVGVLTRRVCEDDGLYGFALPVVDPDLVVNASKFGNLCRLINHSDDDWNAELVSVHHEGLLHVLCRAIRDIMLDEQVLIHYGKRYWMPESRRQVRLGGSVTDTS
ncbi:EHMT2 [Symbiodinium natans]|uniref:EHMT2 protein n=1 Tax=Symbiodinium natans TaxID=878477 RepID=A0A812NUC8_9DINO|nr:EHMT2 [Symbiodinium natans]